MTLVFPLVFYPLLFGVMGDLLERQQQHLTELVPRVLTVVEGEAPRLIQALRSSTALAPVFLDSEQAAIAALGRGQGDLVLIVKRLPKRGELGYRITIQLDASSQEAQVALAKVKSFLQAFLQEETLRRLAALGVKEEEVKPPFDIQVVDTGGQQAMGRAILAQILPYFLILSILSGAMGFGAEITAGEKERGTISTLLSSRLSREEIVIGKFLAILSVSLVSTLVSAVGLIGGITLAGSSLGGSVSLASLSLTTAGWILAVLVPLAVVLATLVLIVGSFARSQKEASMYLLPLYMLIILLGMAIMMGGSDPQGLDFAIPVAGSMAAIRAAIVRGLTPGELGWTFLASLPLGAVLLWLGVLVYRSEKVLFRL